MFIAILSLLTGMVLGQRFKVLVLLPAITLAALVAVGAGMARGQAPSTIALTTLAAIASVQLGYLLGLAIRHLVAVLRASRLRAASFAHSAPARR